MLNWTRKIKVGLCMVLIFIWSGHFFESLSSMPKPAHPMQESRSEGLQLIEETCVQCHDLARIFSQDKTEEAWQRTIAIMMWRGAQLLPGEAEIIQNYLVLDFNRNPGPSFSTIPGADASVDSSLPDGSGRRLVAEACVRCHDLSRIVSQRKSGEEWRRTVQEMVRLGTPLSAGEAETVIDYLSKSFAFLD